MWMRSAVPTNVSPAPVRTMEFPPISVTSPFSIRPVRISGPFVSRRAAMGAPTSRSTRRTRFSFLSCPS